MSLGFLFNRAQVCIYSNLKDGQTLRELKVRLKDEVTEGHISKSVRLWETLGLVEIRILPHKKSFGTAHTFRNGRRFHRAIFLTEKGKFLYKEIKEMVRESQKQRTDG